MAIRDERWRLVVVYASGRYRTMAEFDAVIGAVFVAKPFDPDVLCEMLSEMVKH